MQNRIFETWSIKGTRFLSVPADQGVRIIDQAGNNYGTWFSVDEFKDFSDIRALGFKVFESSKAERAKIFSKVKSIRLIKKEMIC